MQIALNSMKMGLEWSSNYPDAIFRACSRLNWNAVDDIVDGISI